ncbi:hypothetical protein CVT25_000702 [Psilocybe cyanescens]|uniref:Uncharacterized protein n=1 Tax=Psilocybe cyanescens TaxID=93625 RepID=A0A409WZJ3_PSICY|nr:hypothetical protein CVT25_000702 [Psilocybe cyanescens]
MAPTVLFARIALTNPNSTDASASITHIIGLQFASNKDTGNGSNANATGGDVNASVHAEDAEPTPVIEVKRVFRAGATPGENQI